MPVTLPSTGKCFLNDPGRAGSLLVFADDWGRHPSSCQYLVRHLLGRHEVTWVNTIGTRTPRLDWATVRRGLEKIRGWLHGGNPAAANDPVGLHVLNPRMWPSFGSSACRWLNRTLLERQLAPLLRNLPEAPVAVTTIPLVADLVGILPVRRWIYYCVDDFAQWPGLDQSTLQRMERILVDRVDAVVAVSEVLQQRLAQMGRSSHLLTHGVELDFWAEKRPGVPVPQLDGLERPLIAFWGVVDRRMDVDFLKSLSAAMPRGTIVLAGPSADPDPQLDCIARLRRLGPLELAQLPPLAQQAAALVMPYADLPVTRAIQPLKLKEYLVTGRPVIVRDLPATRPWADCLDLADSPQSFAKLVCARVESGLLAAQQASRARLAAEAWHDKARQFEEWVFAEHPASQLATNEFFSGGAGL